MRAFVVGVLTVAMGGAAAGCGGSPGSCTVAFSGVLGDLCVDSSPSYTTSEASSRCAETHGAFWQQSCASLLVGTCTVTTGGTTSTGYYHSGTAADDERACVDMGGTWTPSR